MIFVLIWAVLWLLTETPAVTFDPLNSWATGLIAAAILGVFARIERR